MAPTPSDFVHLHLHSEFSLLDGAIRSGQLVKRVKEMGMGAVALTDHGTMFGVLDFYNKCKAESLQPIIGCEVYITPKSRLERGVGAQKETHHLLLLAQDYEGYLNLGRLSSIGHTEGFYYKPRIDFEMLAKYQKGLVATTSCLAGLIPQALLDGNDQKVRDIAGKFIDIFGRDRFFVELMDHGIAEQHTVNRGLVALARRENLRLIATNDCHYLNREDAEMHDVLLCIQTGRRLADPDRMKFDCQEFYVKSPAEMIEIFKEVPDAITNTRMVADICKMEMPKKTYHLPHFPCPDGKTEFELMKERVLEGSHRRYGAEVPQHVQERINYELSVIERMGFAAYFLIVSDFIAHARSKDIPVGPGRGSAAGSVVAYCLAITELDPLEHGLLFERFLNPDRLSMPDIDVDFCFERRLEVVDYVREKYGADCVSQIITFGTMKAKAAIRDVGRVLDVPLAQVDKMAKMVPEGPKVTLASALEESADLKNLVETDPLNKRIFTFARKIEGMVRHASIHDAGVVIADRPLTDYCPVYKAPGDDNIATQFTMTEVEEAIGLLKMDFLGIKNLTIIRRVERWLAKHEGITIDWTKIPLTDPKTYAMLGKGQTLGVFQLESEGMTALVKNLKPTEFADLTALIALYRPGPLQANMHTMYVDRKHGREPVAYDHPCLEPILKETYGVIVYQEQVMRISVELSGFTPGEADMLRKAMGKKKADVMEKMEKQFIDGAAKKHGVPHDKTKFIWDQIVTFAGYGFNKSHSAAYAVVTYQTAYLRANYPVYFMAALLTNEISSSTDAIARYVSNCREMHIEVLPANVNKSREYFTVDGNTIWYALAAIKGLGEHFAEAIVQEREKGGEFRSLQEFCRRVPRQAMNSRQLESLIKVGAFDCIERNRAALMAVMNDVLEISGDYQRDREGGQGSLFEVMVESGTMGVDDVALPNVRPWDEKQRATFEKEFLGFHLVDHPLNRFRAELESFGSLRSTQLSDRAAALRQDESIPINMIGHIASVALKTDKNGATWAIVTLEDLEGTFECKFFAKSYERCREALQADAVVLVSGRLSSWNGRASFDGQNVLPADALRREARGVRLEWSSAQVSREALFKLKEACHKWNGPRSVEVVIRHPAEAVVTFQPEGLRITLSDDSMRALAELPGRPKITYITPPTTTRRFENARAHA